MYRFSYLAINTGKLGQAIGRLKMMCIDKKVEVTCRYGPDADGMKRSPNGHIGLPALTRNANEDFRRVYQVCSPHMMEEHNARDSNGIGDRETGGEAEDCLKI